MSIRYSVGGLSECAAGHRSSKASGKMKSVRRLVMVIPVARPMQYSNSGSGSQAAVLDLVVGAVADDLPVAEIEAPKLRVGEGRLQLFRLENLTPARDIGHEPGRSVTPDRELRAREATGLLELVVVVLDFLVLVEVLSVQVQDRPVFQLNEVVRSLVFPLVDLERSRGSVRCRDEKSFLLEILQGAPATQAIRAEEHHRQPDQGKQGQAHHHRYHQRRELVEPEPAEERHGAAHSGHHEEPGQYNPHVKRPLVLSPSTAPGV